MLEKEFWTLCFVAFVHHGSSCCYIEPCHERLCGLDLPTEATLADVKQAICQSTGISRGEQRLFQSGDYIHNDMRIMNLCDHGTCETWLFLIRMGQARASALEQVCAGMGVTNLDNSFGADREIVEAALENYWKSSGGDLKSFVAQEIKRDRKFLLHCLKLTGAADVTLDLAAHELKSDREFIMAALQAISFYNAEFVLHHASPDLYSDPSFALAAVQVDHEVFKTLPNHLKSDPNFVLDATRTNFYVLNHLPEGLWYNYGFVSTLVSQTAFAMDFVPQDLWRQREFVLEVVQIQGSAWQRASANLRQDLEILVAAATNDSAVLKLASPKMRQACRLQMQRRKAGGA